MPKSLSKFLDGWLNPKTNPRWSKWLRRDDTDAYSAYCAYCMKRFSVSTMGAQAITSHENSVGHRKSAAAADGQSSIASMFQKPAVAATRAAADEVVVLTPPQPLHVKEATVKAEIIWCLKAVRKGFSNRSSDDLPDTFRAMFPDSQICGSFSLGRDKQSYTVVYGLAPYFKKELANKVKQCSEFTILFDEAFNSIAQQGQMDIWVRFWDDGLKRVSSRFFSAVFLQRATAAHLVESFKEGLDSLPQSKILQISMDGPSVNHKFYRDIKQDIETSPDDPRMIDIGTCSLHVVNGAFQVGHKASKWNINGFLRSLYYMFSKCPARRAGYSHTTTSNLFPLKFCQVRWTENSRVAGRGLEMVPYLRVWVDKVNPKPASQVFDSLCQFLSTPLLEARLEFFKSVAELLEPYLTMFQTEKPMVPFLFGQMRSLLRVLLGRFVKDAVLDAATTTAQLMDLDLKPESDNFKPKPDVGFGASKRLGHPSVTQLQKIGFYSDCRAFYRAMTHKVIERCPLNYKVVRAASCFSPNTIKSDPALAKKRIQSLLEILVDNNRAVPATADKTKQQFAEMLQSETVLQSCGAFDMNTMGLDEFFIPILDNKPLYSELWSVVKMVLIMSHGNATVESGFSVNEDLLVENLKNESLVALRQVYDAIQCYGGHLSVPLTPGLLKSVCSARGRYRESLESKKTMVQAPTLEGELKRQAEQQIQDLQAKKQALLADARVQEQQINRHMAALQKKL